jgi:ABC-2 type transport system ATP-binding protein
VNDVVRATGLVKRFNARIAVDHVDLRVGAGERVALLGPNGAGKTTTLLMLLGAITPDEGSIEVAGYALPRHRTRAAAQVGFAAGYLPLAERMRVDEYLRMYAQLYGIADPRDRIVAALEALHIAHLARSMGTELSSGQRTLVGIVKATLHEPKLLILDEPTASLDPDVAQRVRTGLLDVCAERGTALLITSHNMAEIERLCERVIFLSRGRVVADGTPGDVTASYGSTDLEDLFLHLAAQQAVPGAQPLATQETDHP